MDGCRFSFWYTEVSAYYVYNIVYLCHSLLEQQIELVLKAHCHSGISYIQTKFISQVHSKNVGTSVEVSFHLTGF